MWPFGSDDDDTDPPVSNPSVEVLVAGGESIYSFKADDDLSPGEAVAITGSACVEPCDDFDRFYGVAAFGVASGEMVAVLQAPAIVRVEYEGDISANDGATLADSMTWRKDNDNRHHAIVHSVNAERGTVELELRPQGKVVRAD